MVSRAYRLSPKVRFEILKRDGFKCAYCGCSSENAILEIDHIIPRASGGSDDKDNLITACRQCNRGKSATTLIEITSEDNIIKLAPVDSFNTGLKQKQVKIENKICLQNPQISFGTSAKYVHAKIYLEEITQGKGAEAANSVASKVSGVVQTVRTTQRYIKQFKLAGITKSEFISDTSQVMFDYNKRVHALEYVRNLSKGYSALESNEIAKHLSGINQTVRTTERHVEKLRFAGVLPSKYTQGELTQLSEPL